jgi:uncharacterized membrane protein
VHVVTLWWFSSPVGAGAALELLLGGPVALHDAAVVSWPPDRSRPDVQRPGRIVGDLVLGGAFCGLVTGLPIMSPLVASAVGAGVGLLMAGTTRPWLPRDAVRDARRRVTAGTSVLVLLSDGVPVGHLLDRLAVR